jgi:hypothetical protein
MDSWGEVLTIDTIAIITSSIKVTFIGQEHMHSPESAFNYNVAETHLIIASNIQYIWEAIVLNGRWKVMQLQVCVWQSHQVFYALAKFHTAQAASSVHIQQL